MTFSEPTTIGMRIDAVIASLESLPRANPEILYASLIGASLMFSFLVLNSGGSSMALPDGGDADSLNKPKKISNAKPVSSSDEPQPKWHILRLTNYVVTFGFLLSVLKFASNATTYLDDSTSLLQFLIIWSISMCYFFGFFGISFIELDELESEPQNHQHQMHRKPMPTKDSAEPPVKVVKMHPPASSAPVCTDPTSFKKPSPSIPANIKELSNGEIASLVLQDKVKDHQLEKLLDPHRAVEVRRLKVDNQLDSLGRGGALAELPHKHDLDYKRVLGANCEIVVGYIPIPVGMAGPITLNGESVYIPMATTEGCLVASTNRGCKAITQGSGAVSSILRDGITRAPCVRLPSAKEASEVFLWIERPENFQKLKEVFESTTSFGKLLEARPTVAGKNVYIRLRCFAGDAMGMNMISKGSLAVIECLRQVFPNISLVALSGNMCTDKKAAAINWIEGRGKSVVIEATIPKGVVRSTLKTSVPAIVEANVNKNLIGSAMAGVVGGFNAHASNNVTAVFLATGQDPAQNVESANCITLMEETPEGDLWISCTMPSIEVGTVGGGTGLPAQAACLKAIGVKGGGENPGDNAKQLAHVVAAATMAGELSLMAALASNSLVAAHMTHNRKPASK
ncbi:hydroxymethylglutaryl-CoA reductase (NADPH) [Skeletonema marinoi]|uniref:3-hydroxy-3-methylglutaryl coenzyme A reductase n=2 Tax=Skeletonema marinoi TaxID=267567 RepID=A0AAD8YM98_9STRA|nr:hydroxymethylglutaryl-CoA reductase (NADPH) [Skeletonema marinoi]